MAAITDVPKQGFDQLLETNRQMHNTMTDMNKLLSNLVSLMQKNEIVMEPDLERGIHRPKQPAPDGYSLRAAPTSFKLGESDAAGNLYASPSRQGTGIDFIAQSQQDFRPLRPLASRRGTWVSHPSRRSYSRSSSDNESDDDKSDILGNDQPFTRRAMSFILKQKVPDVDDYDAHFQALQDAGPASQPGHALQAIDWKMAIVSGLNASAPPFTGDKNRLGMDLFDKYATTMMSSLFLSEVTYPFFEKMSKVQFETMHAPRLYEFLESTMAPYAWRSDQVISHFHPVHQHFDWDIALQLVCSVGPALQRAQHEITDDYDYYTAGLGDRDGEETRTRFELILENECTQAGLLPADRGGQGRMDWRVNLRHESTYWLAEKIRKDFLVDEPGLSYTPRILSLARYYHGATYVPQPDPIPSEVRRFDPFTYGDEGFQKVEKMTEWASTFEPTDLALETIKTTKKEWSIVWTSNLEEHLWVQDFKIFVWWCPTALFHRPRGPRSLKIEEVCKTYGLLFASTAKKLASKRQGIIQETDKYSVNGRSLVPFEKTTKKVTPIEPLKNPYRSMLATWLSTPCPHHIAQVFAHIHPVTDDNTDIVPEMTIGEVLALNPDGDIPEDLVIQLQGILLYPHKLISENYSEYPYFGERLRYMNFVLQMQKPRSLTELWRDQRDSLQWWTFWLVVWFGIASVVLAVGSLATSVAQTWAAFEALPPN